MVEAQEALRASLRASARRRSALAGAGLKAGLGSSGRAAKAELKSAGSSSRVVLSRPEKKKMAWRSV